MAFLTSFHNLLQYAVPFKIQEDDPCFKKNHVGNACFNICILVFEFMMAWFFLSSRSCLLFLFC